MISYPASTTTLKGTQGNIRRRLASRSRNGFTLIEMLTAMTVLLIVLGIIGAATNSARTTIQRSTTEIGAFAAARSAFENISQKISQATLNTYWDYYDANGLSRGAYAAYDSANNASTTGGFVPANYGRASDLHFFVQQNTQIAACGQEIYFQTPVAYSTTASGSIYPYQDTQGLMNSCGYFVEYCPDSYRPNPLVPYSTATAHWRFRLMQGLEPTENFSVFSNVSAVEATKAAPTSTSWTWMNNICNEINGGSGPTVGKINSSVVPIADNVIAMVVWPRQPLRIDVYGNTITTNFTWDSQKDLNALPTSSSPQKLYDEQLPPIVELTLVVIDEASATRLAATTSGATPPPAITTAFNTAKTNSGTSAATIFAAGNETQYNKDVAALGAALSAAKINYKILDTFVVMRESKWSQ